MLCCQDFLKEILNKNQTLAKITQQFSRNVARQDVHSREREIFALTAKIYQSKGIFPVLKENEFYGILSNEKLVFRCSL